MEWEIGAECLACVLIVLVLCFSREKFYTQMPQTRLYYACLGFALFSTLLNIATVVLMGVPSLLPRWLCYTLNMLYFTFFPLLEAALTYYMAYLIHGRGRASRALPYASASCWPPHWRWCSQTRSQVGCFIWTRRAHMCAAVQPAAVCAAGGVLFVAGDMLYKAVPHGVARHPPNDGHAAPSGDGAGDGAVSVPARHDDGLYPGVHFAGAVF